jgi:type I restriction enzyme R subunit
MHEEQAEGYATAKLRWTIGEACCPSATSAPVRSPNIGTCATPSPAPARSSASTGRRHCKSGSRRTRCARLTKFPRWTPGLRDCQVNAITNLEQSLSQNKPRALVQMATGSGKTFTAITSVYRLLKPPVREARALPGGHQEPGRSRPSRSSRATRPTTTSGKFTELYAVQRLTSSFIDPGAQVCISTIQRMYSILQGEALDESAEEQPGSDTARV